MEDSIAAFSGSSFPCCPNYPRCRRCVGGTFSGAGRVKISHRSNPGVEATLLVTCHVEDSLFAFEAQLLFEKLQALCEYYGTMDKPVNRMYLRMLVGSSVPGTELGFLLVGTWSVPLSGTRGSGSCLEGGGNDTGLGLKDVLTQIAKDVVGQGLDNASVGQRLEQHPAELGWSAPSAAFAVASSATQQRVHSDGQGLP
ncbi:hypothetical protein F2Q69_00006281 [Brassica cretica]|uniref:Uncharacterized protein n=1 Tax=Brassica cretica TaxID=69181 RepID=A0A8S9P2L5_BRACR|nr:hypothetical protein F2Q69_00006281 [Brassica cretica]